MDIERLFIQLVLALACAGAATFLIPRKIPGKIFGLIVIGLTGVWFGEWGFYLIQERFNLDLSAIAWDIEGVPIVPAIIGSAIVLYLVTAFLSWGRIGT